ncbi:MAG: adenine phosphoribosyltransferase [candidate division Zixibacteria bacterium]|nr:adenine phosphoribosyltransferase [candidate division Zixibacteria bacterium]MDH3938958.1 adenine phosphoribosyltransferase [candidate division Zixibacteria bacterium]MDH4035744.1 adenine phosphoribosyltransferase [candidate division Zixibacteria bacterium]
MTSSNDGLKKYIRSVPDFPKPGINFYDITTLLQDPDGFGMALDAMEQFARDKQTEKILVVESRGFLFGAALADRLNVGLVLARKPGKLPHKTISAEYALEYGTDSLELHQDAVRAGERVLIVDDLIATGGTLQAVCGLVEQLDAQVVGISAVIDLSFLPWREKLSAYDVDCLIAYDSE